MKDNNPDNKAQGGEGKKEEIKFPISYELKVIFDTKEELNIYQRNLELVLEDAKVKHSFVKSNPSSKGKFVSITMAITLNDKEQMDYLYQRLKLLPGIKLAV